MTKKALLKWRLKDSLTTEDVLDLLEKKVVNEEEARSLLFNEGVQGEDVKALKEQVRFLRDTVKILINQRDPAIAYRYIYNYTPRTDWTLTTTGSDTSALVGWTNVSSTDGHTVNYTAAGDSTSSFFYLDANDEPEADPAQLGATA